MTARIRAVLVVALALLPATAHAQSAVRARYANGQVWVSWIGDPAPPETYAIYKGATPFTQTRDAALVGRLFRDEWLPVPESTQTSPPVTQWRVPTGTGAYDTLATNEGLFVDTVVDSLPRYYAVVRWGDSLVTAANRSGKVHVTFSLADPPQCHLQTEYVQDGLWTVSLYTMWADGRDDESTARADFPVAANRYKNGMPSLFFLSRPQSLPAGLRPLVHWLHGGEGQANQSLPGDRPSIGIDPDDGFLCAHNDDFPRYLPGIGVFTKGTNSWWVGWARSHDPFDTTFVAPAPGDTIVNYTQRRIVWINSWLIAHFPIDSTRVALQGHSVGSAGVTALGKAYPQLWSSVSVFNNGLVGPLPESDGPPGQTVPSGYNLFGYPQDDLPTVLRGPGGVTVRAYDLFDIVTPIAPARDLPVWRVLDGKHDRNAVMGWTPAVVAQYRAADSLGLGMHLYWDEREHGLGTRWAYFSHANTPSGQTQRDDAVYQGQFRTTRSFPGFYNHRLYANAHDPGDGTPGTSGDSLFSGDDWGTWGGFHTWTPDSITDTPTDWTCPYWLINGSAWLPDNCPSESLQCDVSIRRPQQFVPAAGTPLTWTITTGATRNGPVIASGSTTVAADGVVRIAGVWARRSPNYRWLHVTTSVTGAANPASHVAALRVSPTLVRGDAATVRFTVPRAGEARLEAFAADGRRVLSTLHACRHSGAQIAAWPRMPAGVYWLRVTQGTETARARVVVAR